MQAENSVDRAEALSTRLCRKGELLLYEIDLLRRDGRVLKVFVDAVSGKPLVSHSIINEGFGRTVSIATACGGG